MPRYAALASFALLVPACMALNLNARQTSGNNNINGNCGANEELYVGNGGSYCCPGAVYGDTSDDKYCCIGATFQVATPTFASCFPMCSNTAENDASVSSTTTQTCRATVALTDSAYSSKVSALASGGTVATSDATTTTSGGAAAGVTSTTSGGGAAALMTSGPMAGIMMMAGGLAMAL